MDAISTMGSMMRDTAYMHYTNGYIYTIYTLMDD